MAYREVRVVDYREVVRRWLAGDGIRSLARGTGLDRKTVRRIVRAAERMGLKRGDSAPDDKIIAALVGELSGIHLEAAPGETERCLLPYRDRIRQWLEEDKLLLTRVHDLLARDGVLVPYASLHRFAHKQCNFARSSVTVRRVEGKPGEYAEVDFGRLGYLQELGSAKPRVVHGFVMVLGYSRLSCVVPVFRQDLESVIRCFEEALRFFGGCPRRIVVDNMKSCLDLADPLVPRFNRTFLEYAAFREFIPDPARPYHPQDKPAVEQHVRFVRERFFRGTTFVDLDDVARRALLWCRETAGRRVHGTTRRVPLDVFEAEERGALIPLTAERFVLPKWGTCTVHPDHHVRFDSASYSVPTRYIGQKVDVRADGALVRIYRGAEVIKTHKQQPRGGRSTDYEDYPKERGPYAMRNVMARNAPRPPACAPCRSTSSTSNGSDTSWSRHWRTKPPAPVARSLCHLCSRSFASCGLRSTSPTIPLPQEDTMQIRPELKTVLKRMKLSPMLATLPDRVAFAREQKLDFTDFLELVLSDEAERRDQVSIQTRLRHAGFEEECALERFDWTANIELDRTRLNELFGLHFIERHENIIFTGAVGVGKTYLACALGHAACRAGYRVLFTRADTLLKTLAQSRVDNSFDRQLRQYLTPDVLVLDDFGLRRLSGLASSDFYELIIERHMRSSTIVTSNRAVEEWGPLFEEPMLAQSALDRFCHRAHQLIIEGESYRARQSAAMRSASALAERRDAR
jgi:DNA replication protein DnaC/transposase